MQELAETWVFKVIFDLNGFEGLYSIQALLVLAHWRCSGGGGGGNVGDGRVLITAAVSLSNKIGLGRGVERLREMKRESVVDRISSSPFTPGEWADAEMRAHTVRSRSW